jgi:hypothetical protein
METARKHYLLHYLFFDAGRQADLDGHWRRAEMLRATSTRYFDKAVLAGVNRRIARSWSPLGPGCR